jgi:hypothetical protein
MESSLTFFSTNNELVQMLRVLGPLIKWSEIRFLTLAYEENLIGRGKFTLHIVTKKNRVLYFF